MSSNILSPDVYFPFEELEERVQFIKDKEYEIYDYYSTLYGTYSQKDRLSGKEEKVFIDQSEREAGKYLSELIHSEFPNDTIRGEELKNITGNNDFSWILDPIDGGLNFLRGIPYYAISFGILFRESRAAGVVLIPELDDLYEAIKYREALKNDEPINTSKVNVLSNSILIPAYPQDRKKTVSSLIAEISATIVSGHSLRRTGSFCLDMCWLAEGRVEGLWEKNLTKEDLASVSIILEEAGGMITDEHGKPFSDTYTGIIASNGHIHESLVELLEKSHKSIHLN